MPVPKKIIAGGACLACIAAVWGYQAMEDAGWFSSSSAVSLSTAPKSKPAAPVVSTSPKGTPAENTSALSIPPTVQTLSAPMTSPADSGTLGDLTKIRSEVEMMKEAVKLEELKVRLQELKTTKESPPPAAPVMSPELMAALTPPSALQALPPPSVGISPPLHGSYRLLGIQSCGDAVTASVQTPDGGERIIAVGDRLGTSRVKSISPDGVRLSSGKTLGW